MGDPRGHRRPGSAAGPEPIEPIGDIGRPLPAPSRWPRLPHEAAMLEHLRAIRLLAGDHGLGARLAEAISALERLLLGEP